MTSNIINIIDFSDVIKTALEVIIFAVFICERSRLSINVMKLFGKTIVGQTDIIVNND